MASLVERIGSLAQAVASRFNGLAGQPAARTIALGTAYRPTVTGKSALFTVTLTSTATITLTGGATNSADLVIGPAATISTTGGTVVGKYANTNTGALTVGLSLSTVMTNSYTLAIPPGWYFAIRSTAGTVSVVSAFEQALG